MHSARRPCSKASSFISLFMIALAILGCDENERANGAGGTSDGAGGNNNAPAICDITLSHGENDTEALQTALIEADPDSTIGLQPGTYVFEKEPDRPTFRDIKAYWADGSVTANGAYALYPALSNNVLIEHCEVVGASDAGVYLGQSSTATRPTGT